MDFLLRAVNWRDGMALQESDFRTERFSLDERLRWALHHGIDGYGLVPSHSGAADPLLLEPQTADGKLTLHLNRCIALAPDGSLIHIDSTIPDGSGGTPPVSTVMPLQGGAAGRTVHVFVQSAGSRFIEHGSTTDGEPVRQRWRYPEHRLKVLDEIPSGAPDLLEIARFKVEGSDAIRLDSFIPPCLAIGSHPKLREKAEQMAGLLEQCRNSAVQVVERLAQDRQERGEAALSSVPAEMFARHLGLTAIRSFSRLIDAGATLAPRELVAVGRSFLRQVQTLIEVHPELKRGSWERFLQSSGRIDSHVRFRREVESQMGGPVPHHPILDSLNPALELIRLVADFPLSLSGEDPGIKPSDETGTDYIYQGKTYYNVRYAELQYHARGELHYLDIRGLPPKPGGRFLIYLKCEDPEQRAMAATLRCGGPDKRSHSFMDEQVPDVEHDRRAILLILGQESGQSHETIHVACRQENVDLSRLSTAPGDDVRLYHKP